MVESNEHAIITKADLRQLLDAAAPDARLVLSEGKVGIHSGSDDAGGGILVISRADLVGSLGDPGDERRLAELAAVLDSDIRLLGA
ncbi:hypothetical protein BOX37_15620 [Nocardia mangyaensis]|uniref:Uncharacterized protein n=1 Tax=Nocardia mangyaensis TaxID=2213200 RepID=A0A1J0VSW4_9NOCA|nr:hypothetical protein [Nocardia mangyaensis]APE35139.1 hypothetical protein BOX37_15620 [Nocardia mangyaensis]